VRADQEDGWLGEHLVSKPHDLAIKVKPSLRLNLLRGTDGALSDVGMHLPSPQNENTEGFQN